MKPVILFLCFSLGIISCNRPEAVRKHISLNGKWEITKTEAFDELPQDFLSTAPVPGLVDLATPALDTGRLYEKGVYWYKTHFTIEQEYPELIQLEIGKAKYHTVVYLNNELVGEHPYCFTPGRFDVSPFLNSPGSSNELVIGVGVVSNVSDSVIWGHDFEKLTYIPGIYDDVLLILTGYPFIENIQTVPNINNEEVRIVSRIDDKGKNDLHRLSYVISELVSGKTVAEGESTQSDFTVQLPGFKIWTPDSPFLYKLEISTEADSKTVRFGMRSFEFDSETRQAVLNGKPYYMRGTNVCIFRFFEDPERGTLPWRDDWVINLHQQFKNMHWNSMRYCIGLPPERWYDIADSLGFLIQNEYPVWTGGPGEFEETYPGVKSQQLANEYRTWLPEHWNHASVVIWDAQNESVTQITGEAINMVREMDLSNRPWENGWSAPVHPSDPIESHPYLFSRYRKNTKPSPEGPLADLLSEFIIPGNDPNKWMPSKDGGRYPNPVIINEYAWLWLNRDGSTTTLTDDVYVNAFGDNLSKEERINLYCRHLGILTEFWRAHRYCAGILHFCGLAYSRPEEPRGQTSDHFIDIENLRYEPQFVKYVKPAFAPVGLMLNYWENKAKPGAEKEIEIFAINDLQNNWQGKIKLFLQKDEKALSTQESTLQIPFNGREIIRFKLKMPMERGHYQLIAEIVLNDEIIQSIREISIE